jgi:3-methyladenine DNA glycosylase AlkC
LDEVSKFQVKIADFWPDKNTKTTYIVDGVLRFVAAEVENAFP